MQIKPAFLQYQFKYLLLQFFAKHEPQVVICTKRPDTHIFAHIYQAWSAEKIPSNCLVTGVTLIA